MTTRSAVLIVNAQSRKGQAQFAAACAALKALPFPVDAHAITDPDTLDTVIKTALAAKPDLMILGGGDGTISGLVDHLVGTDTALGVLPLGTANSFARTLGIPLDIEGAVEVLRTGRRKRIDLGMIDKDYFANCAAIGIAPQIAQTVPHTLKKYLGRLGYLSWAALQYAKFRPFELVIEDAGIRRSVTVVEVRISNGGFHGGTEIVDDARVDSGEIIVQAVTGSFKRRLLKNWIASALRLPARHDDTVSFTGTALRVSTTPRLPISIDGEVLAKTPVTARIAAGVIEVIVPAEESVTPA
ncbi:diacylglycerol/lipid kinase family protein [Hephaestia sp. GCM10023244]|uniref:diacylglycerol/lipid kinase family protein n=1 Tax=unclassified Hephaestia TaxID=2631281 RepID=UPI0020773DF8|nr:YegS/Rv2252/BmrU family lipid kinase [Hephaestia sp. MAHUQ-44]MCM8730236.1 YegS/Rv2252/BmrU family lipid kinase [Hephaestia sp. MAHUQ-44]